MLKIMFWSLNLRWWVYRQSDQWVPQIGRIKLFVLYHQPREAEALEHSLGLQKGLTGVVHAFADPRQTRQNNIVIAHERLHTLGATDKYGPDGMPLYPGVTPPPTCRRRRAATRRKSWRDVCSTAPAGRSCRQAWSGA